MSMTSIKIKDRHIEICCSENVEYVRIRNGFESFKLLPNFPNFSYYDIDLSTQFLRKKLRAPILISPLTGGGEKSKIINYRLAQAAGEFGIAMAVGSQRVMLMYEQTKESFMIRKVAPNVVLFANLGLVHLNYGIGYEECVRVVEEIEADGLMIYVNPVHEAFQTNGCLNWSNILDKLKQLCEKFPYPVILKEVGFGFSYESLLCFKDVKLSAVDVAGAGGTNWLKIEAKLQGKAAEPWFDDIGIPTAESLLMAKKVFPHIPIIASGGVRNGCEIAKALAMGADLVGIGLPFLKYAVESEEAVLQYLQKLTSELRLAMWYSGARTLDELKGRIIIDRDGKLENVF